jgi:hypothetical protein
MKKCICGKELTKKQKYSCSISCQQKRRNVLSKNKNVIDLVCRNCKKNFKKKRYMINKKSKHFYCSLTCSDEHKKTTMIGNKNFKFDKEHYKNLSVFMKNKWKNDIMFRNMHEEIGFLSFESRSKGGVAGNSKNSVAKRKRTLLEKHGVNHNFNIPSARVSLPKKAHETRKKNKTYGKSKIEDVFFESLCEIFGKENVERQIAVESWLIDFKINKTFIQFDGVYWHGLDRPLKEVLNPTTHQGESIKKTYYRDIIRQKWFLKNNKKLVRITDIDYSRMTINQIKEVING